MSYTFISAKTGDQIPGAELAELGATGGDGLISPPDLANLTALPQVRQFFQDNRYGDDPDEVMYLVGEATTRNGWPTLTVTRAVGLLVFTHSAPADEDAVVNTVNTTLAAATPAPGGHVSVVDLLDHIAPNDVRWCTWLAGHERPAPTGAADLGDYQYESGPRDYSNGFSFARSGLAEMTEAAGGEPVFLVFAEGDGAAGDGLDCGRRRPVDEDGDVDDAWYAWRGVAARCDRFMVGYRDDGDLDTGECFLAVRLDGDLPVEVYQRAVELIQVGS